MNIAFGLSSGYSIVPFASLHWQSKMWLDALNHDGAHLSQAQDENFAGWVLRLTP